MPRIVREAEHRRGRGTLSRGAGHADRGVVRAPSSSAVHARRRGSASPEGKTSPEELLAAAHGGCFTMSLAGELAEAGTPPERLDVHCTITMDEVEGRGTRSSLRDRGARRRAGRRRGGVRAGGRGGRRGLPVLGAHRGAARRVDRRTPTLEGGGSMATIARRTSTWYGIAHGGRRDDRRASASGAFGPLDVTLGVARRGAGRTTSPEELIAAAHAACFSMALSARARAGGHAGRAARRRRRPSRSCPARGSRRSRSTVAGTRARHRRSRRSPQAAEAAKAAARSRRRSPACPRSRSTPRSPERTSEPG